MEHIRTIMNRVVTELRFRRMIFERCCKPYGFDLQELKAWNQHYFEDPEVYYGEDLEEWNDEE